MKLMKINMMPEFMNQIVGMDSTDHVSLEKKQIWNRKMKIEVINAGFMKDPNSCLWLGCQLVAYIPKGACGGLAPPNLQLFQQKQAFFALEKIPKFVHTFPRI